MNEMVKILRKPNAKMQAWIDARKRHGLSHAEVQMARELGMNPKKLGKLDNHYQEPWKMPLRQFIQHLYFKRFGKEHPDIIQTIEEKTRRDAEKKAIRRETRLLRRQNETTNRQFRAEGNVPVGPFSDHVVLAGFSSRVPICLRIFPPS